MNNNLSKDLMVAAEKADFIEKVAEALRLDVDTTKVSLNDIRAILEGSRGRDGSERRVHALIEQCNRLIALERVYEATMDALREALAFHQRRPHVHSNKS